MGAERLNFLKFQEQQGGILLVSDAAELANRSAQSILNWAARNRFKTILHRGKLYVGRSSFSDYIRVRNWCLGAPEEGRRWRNPRTRNFAASARS